MTTQRYWLFASCISLASCTATDSSEILSQTFVHKYGFDLSPEEWVDRSQEGQVITRLQDGVIVTQNYENGALQGLTTYSFPHSPKIEKERLYDQGTLLQETSRDEQGIPIQQEIYEFDQRTIVTQWNEKGVPTSIEEFVQGVLTEGKYYTGDHELEARVEDGFGERVKRDRSGLLVSRDTMEEGELAARIQYHPNGHIQSISHYAYHQLHGDQLTYTPSGKPLLKLSWNRGLMDGQKVIYRNGSKIAEIPYQNGLKQGTEVHYDDLGNLTAEIQWRADQKHGYTKFYAEEIVESEWFFNGTEVSAERFDLLSHREELIAEMHQDFSTDAAQY